MAFGEEKHKKSTFEIVTLVIVVVMVSRDISRLDFTSNQCIDELRNRIHSSALLSKVVFKLLNVCFFKIPIKIS